MKTFGLILVIIAGGLLIYAAQDLPDWGDPYAPAHTAQSDTHYVTQIFKETSVPNLVTAVLADYRGYDTMFETVVVFIAGLAIIGILGMIPGWDKTHNQLEDLSKRWDGFFNPHDDIIVRTTSRLLIPIIQLFALYVIAHGHYSPGGGFQGGVIFGTSFILIAMSNGLQDALRRTSVKRIIILAAIGVMIYSGFGLACLLLGANFLDYSILHKILPLDPIAARSFSMLGVEVGVAFTVSAIMFAIYAHLSTRGHLDEGL